MGVSPKYRTFKCTHRYENGDFMKILSFPSLWNAFQKCFNCSNSIAHREFIRKQFKIVVVQIMGGRKT